MKMTLKNGHSLILQRGVYYILRVLLLTITNMSRICSRFNDDVLSLTTNRDTRKCFDLYFGYGKEYSDQRKKVLQTKVKHFTDAEVSKIESQHSLTCNRHLDLNTKEFQIAQVNNLIWSRWNDSCKKKIFTVMFSRRIQAMKLFQIGARAAYELSYHR